MVGVDCLSGDTSVCVGSVWQCYLLGYEGVMMQVYCGVTGFEDTLQGKKCPSCGQNVMRLHTDAWYDHIVEGV